VRTALRQTVEEGRLPAEIQAVFEQLDRNLSVRGNDEESLRRFTLAVGHRWADYFAGILRVALTEGGSVADNLRELIADMRQSQLADQQERHRLLEIRLANFAPGIFLLVFMAVNFRLNPEASYRYYLQDPRGPGPAPERLRAPVRFAAHGIVSVQKKDVRRRTGWGSMSFGSGG